MLIILLFSILIQFASCYFKSDPDEYLNTSALVRGKGFPAEEHYVSTDDGYTILIHRIPYGRANKTLACGDEQRPVAFLQHGLLDASSTWVVNMPDQSLGFILADAGYDVWLGNVRGNTYARTHDKYNVTQTEFWDFSWSDMAEHDLPAMINYILKKTGQAKLFYIGHSQGTLIGFSKLSKSEELAPKIRLFVGLGPVAIAKNIKSPIKYLGKIGESTNQDVWYHLFGRKAFLPSGAMIEWLADKMCNQIISDRFICENILFALCGPSKYLNHSRVSVYVTHTPAGASVKDLAHFAQMSISGKFQQYDYGKEENVKRYNQTEAPEYDLKNVRVPVALYWASNDWLADPQDVEYLRENLPKLVDDYELKNWDHLDFIWALNAKANLYDRILNLMSNF